MELHYSQTGFARRESAVGFTTLWKYTILKPTGLYSQRALGFTTLWNYTILKHVINDPKFISSFTTLWNYTILKHMWFAHWASKCFTTLWNYTILKQPDTGYYHYNGFTTLWNYTILKPQIKCAHYHAHGNSIGYLHHTMFSFHCQQFRTNRCQYMLLSLFQYLRKNCFLYKETDVLPTIKNDISLIWIFTVFSTSLTTIYPKL